jgi:Carbohydrate-binding domain-containing protein Cthe_2159
MQNSIKNTLILAILVSFTAFWSCKKDDTSVLVSDSEIIVKSDYTVTSVLAENAPTHDLLSDYVWEVASEINIVLNDNAITCNSANVLVNGNKAIITASGNYNIMGALSDGFILVETADTTATVRLILNGVNINNPVGPAIFVSKAGKAIVVLKDGTDNFLSDGATYIFANVADKEPNATLFSKTDLTISGNGTLSVNAKYADAISSKDGLIVASGTIEVTAKDDGIRGKNYLVIKDGNIKVTSTGDALKSDHNTDLKKGFVHIIKGTFDLVSGSDAIQAITDVLIENGTFNITTGGGSGTSTVNNTAKGLKAGKHVIVDAGIFDFNTSDDALHSNSNLTINAGTFNIASQDDGIHADTSVSINGGDIVISKSFESIEARVIIVNSGNINLTSTDDGFNAAGNTGTVTNHGPGAGSNSNYYLSIRGGNIVVNSGTDGLDSNGAIEMTGGTVLINGPSANNNAAVDFDYSFNISGGFLAAVGSSRMASGPTSGSTQNSVFVDFGSNKVANTLIHIQNAAGVDILTFKPTKGFSSLAFSSPDFVNGSYSVYTGGSHNGTEVNGLYKDGTYTIGTKFQDFTVSSVVTNVN